MVTNNTVSDNEQEEAEAMAKSVKIVIDTLTDQQCRLMLAKFYALKLRSSSYEDLKRLHSEIANMALTNISKKTR